ncbi:hypothetical protein [Arthrobacter sp. NPDC056727]|uniref:hypothetical protein n=1 Tax=Arthrobacter sp. NPDC056727 TaxID=3345927 RepID=UPI00366EC421
MSISVGHRAIVSAFGWGHGPARRTAAAVPAVERPVTTTAVPSAAESAALVCSPWEGLYLEPAHPVSARGNSAKGNNATTGQQLDSFLSSLMYGE